MRAVFLSLILLLGALPASASVLSVNLQPVSLCGGDVVDDTCGKITIDENYLNEIYRQIDIEMTVLDPFAVVGFPFVSDSSGDINPNLALATFGLQFEPLIVPNTIYVAFLGDLTGDTVGLAYLDSVDFPFAIVQDTYSLQVGTQITAHEVGHVMGGEHEDANLATQLMFPQLNLAIADQPGYTPTISDANAATMRSSGLLTRVQVIPVPPALPLLASGALALFALRRRRTA
ncbi:hypothetical protein [Dinoroseobacter sp. S76]|uniref:hypothetical protein n=1 Tax=Dinoroseobacter sp. S76 TaxID=3415124 RepID=UPI003C7DF064